MRAFMFALALLITVTLAAVSPVSAQDLSCVRAYPGGFGCPYIASCPTNERTEHGQPRTSYCVIDRCGEAPCPDCPEALASLVIESYCTLADCRRPVYPPPPGLPPGAPQPTEPVDGFALVFRSRLRHQSIGPYCFMQGDLLPVRGNDGWGPGVP
jgi:hypothetical protein